MRACLALLVLGLSMSSVSAGARPSGPVAVSPRSGSGIALVEARCPTFSWGAVPGATAYELAVYDVEGGDARPVLEERIPGAALSWTPTLERCLRSGRSYAWSVRAATDHESTDWSSPGLFKVESPVAGVTLEEAVLRAVEQHLGGPDDDSGRRAGRGSASRPTKAARSRSTRNGEPNAVAAATILGTEAIRAELVPPDPPQLGFGVRGIVSHSFADSSGVLGESLATGGGPTHGVRGITDSSTGGSAGVRGESSSGATYGVLGVSTSNDSGAAGVRGEGKVGVVGIGTTPSGIGVLGIVESDTELVFQGLRDTTGVFGVTGKGDVDATSYTGDGSGLSGMVLGTSRASSTGTIDDLTDHLGESPACSSGWTMISGGCQITDLDGNAVWILASYPDTSSGTWKCVFRNASAAVIDPTWEAFILCGKVNP